MRYDYTADHLGSVCLELASASRAATGFGAVLLRDATTLGSGRNRRSLPGENELLGGGVDYATHAEQSAILDALSRGLDPSGADLYVLGIVNRGPNSGHLSVRATDDDVAFSCVRCAKTMLKFDINVLIPLPSGWFKLSARYALDTATEFRSAKRQRVFTEQ
jgi:hypothetical protein